MINQISLKRIKHAFIGDTIFEFKQGFYYIYIAVSIIYLMILGQFPESIDKILLPIIIFSDPSVLGLFFIGGIILLEREQGIINAIVVTPLSTAEYLISKVLSLTLIAIVATISISILSYTGKVNYVYLVFGVLLTSILFTLLGVIVGTYSKSINNFFINMVPVCIFMILPCGLIYNYGESFFINLFPGISSFNIIYGAYNSLDIKTFIFNVFYLLIINIFLFKLTLKIFENKMVYGG